MCDYSLETKQSRPAVKGEKLVTKRFSTGTTGLVTGTTGTTEPVMGTTGLAAGTTGLASHAGSDVAVCLLPGTELEFAKDVEVRPYLLLAPTLVMKDVRVARFTQINKDNPWMHHDALEFPGAVGQEPVLINRLVAGQEVTVLQIGCTEVLPDAVVLELREERQEPAQPERWRLEHVVSQGRSIDW